MTTDMMTLRKTSKGMGEIMDIKISRELESWVIQAYCMWKKKKFDGSSRYFVLGNHHEDKKKTNYKDHTFCGFSIAIVRIILFGFDVKTSSVISLTRIAFKLPSA